MDWLILFLWASAIVGMIAAIGALTALGAIVWTFFKGQ